MKIILLKRNWILILGLSLSGILFVILALVDISTGLLSTSLKTSIIGNTLIKGNRPAYILIFSEFNFYLIAFCNDGEYKTPSMKAFLC